MRAKSKRNNHKPRQFIIGSDTSSIYASNAIRTSKYTKLNFLPKAIIIQFRRLANIYFLITAVLQSINIISSLSPASAIAPFILVIALSVIREGVEDIPRQQSDTKVNSSLALVLHKDGQYKETKWRDIKVGDLLIVKDGQEFPTDLVLLKSAHDNGVAFIETASLDGEKNLKPKYALPETAAYFEGENLKNPDLYKCSIYAQAPDSSIYRFEGAFIADSGNKTALLPKQLLLRGAKLKNVEWVVGVAVYTGHDTKVMKNAERSKTKQSRIEHLMNRFILAILIVQAFFCIITALGNRIWNALYLDENWYIPRIVGKDLEGFLAYLSYFILTNTMIPISLIVTIEIVKFIQARLMSADENMYSAEKDKGAKVFCSSINEELGLVDYVFSDKTGTLTSNEMVFKNFVIGNESYGEDKNKATSRDFSEDIPSTNPKAGEQEEESIYSRERFMDGRLQQLFDSQNGEQINFTLLDNQGKEALNFKTQRDLAVEYMQAVATCHECIVEKSKDGGIMYQGQSQDEVRLVETASDAGFKFLGGNIEKVNVQVLDQEKEIKMLQIFEFTSDRKRMSTLVRDGTMIKLYTKGADNVIIDRLRTSVHQPNLEYANAKLEEYSKRGYRTLVYAMRVVTEEEYRKLKEGLDDVAADEHREEKIGVLADAFERDLYLLGCTAVEDKLQDNVPKVIHDLLVADIKVWMLTGDKLETAENIAHSCHLIRGDMHVMRCYGKDAEAVQAKISVCQEEYDMCVQENRKKALIVEGEALTFILSSKVMTEQFINIVLYCDAVVCCRAAPKQKAEMVRLVKDRTNKITLAIGDGANDVNMIQAANIGVGIYGHEGVQAVQASDFAIPEFQCLWKLVIVHGRWSYLRISEMILYFFYKNMLFTLPQFYFAFINGFSAQTLYDDFYVTLYNLIFTALPLGAKAVLEKDVDYRIRLPRKQITKDKLFVEDPKIKSLMPKLYAENKKHLLFTTREFLYWVAKGALLAVLLFTFAMYGVGEHIIDDEGTPSELWFTSITLYTAVILVVSVKLAVQTRYWNIIFVGCLLILSIGLYFAFTVIYDKVDSANSSRTVGQNYRSVLFYAYFVFFAGFELMFDFAREGLRRNYRPNAIDILRDQMIREKKVQKKAKDLQTIQMTHIPINKSVPAGFDPLPTSKNSQAVRETKDEIVVPEGIAGG